VTMQQVADLCGVSIGTAARALNNRPGINPRTREKVLRVSRELGYRPHLLARSLRTGKTMTIGIVVYDLDNRFFAQLVNALETTAKESGYFLYLTLSNHNLDQERTCLEHLVGLNVDGIIIVPTNRGNEFIQFVKSLHVPLVTIGNRLSQAIPFVGIQDREAIRRAVAAAAQKGYRRIIYVSPPLSYKGRENIYEVEERLEGLREGAREHGIDTLILKEKAFRDQLLAAVCGAASGDPAGARAGGASAVGAGARTAVMCSSDIYALESLSYLKAAGVRVPEHCGVIGFDDIDLLRYVTPALTTISYPIPLVAQQAFSVLKHLMAGDRGLPDVPLIESRLILRDSL
jgi:LacI family transcriptional regulator